MGRWPRFTSFSDRQELLPERTTQANSEAQAWVSSLRQRDDFPKERSEDERLLWYCDILYEMVKRVGSTRSCGTREQIARFQAVWAYICEKMNVLAIAPTTGAVAGKNCYNKYYTVRGRLGEHTRGTGELVFERRDYFEEINDFEYHFARNTHVEEYFYYHPEGRGDFYARYIRDDGVAEAVKVFGNGYGMIYRPNPDDGIFLTAIADYLPTYLPSSRREYASRDTQARPGIASASGSDSGSDSDSEPTEGETEGEAEEEAVDENSGSRGSGEARDEEDLVAGFARL